MEIPFSLRMHHRPATATDKSHHLPNRRGFVNPWPSWVKPTVTEFWSGLSWTDVAGDDDEYPEDESSSSHTQLDVVKPDFGIRSHLDLNSAEAHHPGKVRTWWLGHAGILVEFPATDGHEPLRILFDPIFSQRCSPSQYWGPSRFYKAPCKVSDLPPIHVVLISHNHYDHLDANTITELWQLNKGHLRFILPLGNREWMESLLGSEVGPRIWSADWWDEAEFWHLAEGDDVFETVVRLTHHDTEREQLLTSSSSLSLDDDEDLKVQDTPRPQDREHLRIVCTPAQHGSGRFAFDAGSSLWASYNVFFHPGSSESDSVEGSKSTTPFHLFFGGDTGYRLRPPPPALPFPPCPAFLEMHEKFGIPDLLLLPVSVGSTYSYIRSWDPIGVMPNVNGGLTAQNHLDEWEALDVARILSGQSLGDEDFKEDYEAQQQRRDNSSIRGDRKQWALRGERAQKPSPTGITTSKRPLAIAMHFGTFSPPNEAQANLRALRQACEFHSWKFTREYLGEASQDPQSNGTFLVLNHGGRTDVPLPSGLNGEMKLD